MKPWMVVLLKEIRENLRDRRSMLAALVYGPLIGPILFSALVGYQMNKQRAAAVAPLHLPVVGASHAPDLVAWLKTQGVKIQAPPDQPEASVRDQHNKLVLTIPADFAARWNAGQPARVALIYDGSRPADVGEARRAQALLAAYSQRIGSSRLLLRGVAPTAALAVVAEPHDVSTPAERGGALLSFLPYMLMIAVFVGGLYLAIDVTAGERERGSLEPLLIQAVSPGQLFFGKLLATTLFSFLSLGVSLVAFGVALRWVPVSAAGMTLSLSPATLAYAALLLAPVSVLVSALQIYVASGAKSFREAQTYLQFLIFLAAVPSIVLALRQSPAAEWMTVTPLFSQSAALVQMLRGGSLSLLALALSAVPTLLLAAVVMWVAARQFGSERLALPSS